jgi:hypothetical protein
MILTIATLLLQLPAIPQNLSSRTCRATAEITATAPDVTAKTISLDRSEGDARSAFGSGASDGSGPSEEPSVSDLLSKGATATPVSPVAPIRLSGSKLQDPSERLRHREWIVLGIAQHGAATLDAWSTRRALSSGKARELDPMLHPFAGNRSIYAAIQVSPLLFDYLGRRMMASHYGWAKRTWWVVQTVSTVISLAAAAHNLQVH